MPVAPEAQPLVVQAVAEVAKPDTEVINDFALESIPTLDLASKMSEEFKVPVKLSERIIKIADRNAYSDFPSRNDILAIVVIESKLNPKAVSGGSKGLMQIHKSSHMNKLKGRSLFDIEANIEIGVQILREYFLELGGNKKAAILAYNAGLGNYLRKRFKTEYYKRYLASYRTISNM
jgi:hypothetical protein